MLLSTPVGNWLDGQDRKRGAMTVLAVNNFSVAMSAGLLAVCLTLHSEEAAGVYGCFLTLSIIFCAFSKCASDGEKLAFTKDWIVVMAKRESGNTLSTRNATMTTIDQLSSIGAPLAAGFIMREIDQRSACLLFVVWNLVSWLAEAYLLKKVYDNVQELGVRETRISVEDIKKSEDSAKASKATCNMLTAYWRQKVFPAAMGLALLYMTVLGFDGLAVGYGKSQGLTEDVLGMFRAFGSIFGLVGAFSFPFMERTIGLKKTGFVGLVLQQVFLYLCVASVFLAGSPFSPLSYFRTLTFESWWHTFQSAFAVTSPQHTAAVLNSTFETVTEAPDAGIDWSTMTVGGHPVLSVLAFLCGITFARFGLWMADLSITQIMQEAIPEAERGTVFGVQIAMCQLFSVLKDITVIILPDPKTFGLLILISIFFVTCGFLSYCFYCLKGHKSQDKVVEATSVELQLLRKEAEDV
uniref:Solute carrier family 40 member n=1 Tax=Steinernema glaseri TaxID=37863 RepID=A0A1I7Y9T0_9BILA